jgi:hypothetical protein
LYRVITVLVCVGCGAVSTPQPCLGTCIDRRLVGPAGTAAAVTAPAALEAPLAERRTLVERLARPAPAEAEWEPLRARGAPEPGEFITTWSCDSCGHVCIRPETPMVPADVLEQAGAVALELERVATPVRQPAWVTPRPGRLAEAASAVQAAARARLTPEPPRSDTPP